MARLKNAAKKGARLERKSRDWFLKEGALVLRSAGSLGVADLLVLPAFRAGDSLLVLVRANRWPSPADQNDALKVARRHGLGVVFHRWDDGNPREPRTKRIL